MLLEKTMKIDTDDLVKAIEIAQEQLPELELTSEWLDARDISFNEDKFIISTAQSLAKLYHENFDDDNLRDFINTIFRNNEEKEYIYEETLKILETQYNVDINNNLKI